MFINLTNFLKNKFMARSRNQLMMKWSSEKLLIKERKKREKLRISENREHKIYYYHQVDDPYSILVLPLLKKIKLKYNIIIECILVGIPSKKTTPEPDMFQIHCLNDVRNIAPYYGQKKKINDLPKKKNVDIANYILSRCDKTNFIETASVLMEDLWFEKELDISKKFSIKNFNLNETISIIKKGNLIRKKNGYYKEWFSDGSKYIEGYFINNDSTDKWTNWYENGQIKSEKSFKNGIRIGKWTDWFKNGQKKSERVFDENKLNGLFNLWSESGVLITNGAFKNDLKDIIIRIKKKLIGFLNLYPPLTWKVNPVLLSSKTSYFRLTG